MKNKLSRFAVPYEVWMAIFVVAPIVIMVAYAFSSADGGFTLDNFVQQVQSGIVRIDPASVLALQEVKIVLPCAAPYIQTAPKAVHLAALDKFL